MHSFHALESRYGDNLLFGCKIDGSLWLAKTSVGVNLLIHISKVKATVMTQIPLVGPTQAAANLIIDHVACHCCDLLPRDLLRSGCHVACDKWGINLFSSDF